MYGIDISNYQKDIDLSKGIYDFAIIKATEGGTFVSNSFYTFSDQLIKLNKLIGCYHFARPDIHKTIKEMEMEADHFIEVVKDGNLLNRAILVLDWEKEPFDREDLVQAWVLRVESQTGVTPFIYGSKSKLNDWKNWWVVKHCPIWIAAWPTIKRYHVGKDPGLTLPLKSVNWSIWQYSSIGQYPGFNGNVDLDYSDLTSEVWNKLSGKKKEEAIKEVISDDMQWAIRNKLLVGYGDGKYHPKDNLTREQMASLLRRYNQAIAPYGIKEI